MLLRLKNDTENMNTWNKTGKIKALIIAILALVSLLVPIRDTGDKSFIVILTPLVFGCVAVPLILKFNSIFLKKEIIKPTWNDNPLTNKRPISLFYFGAFFFIAIGLSMLFSTLISFQTLNIFGLTSISFGLGILNGIWITLKWLKS
jgi:hypothetical protein